MAIVRVELNHRAVRELLRSEAVRADLARRAQAIAAAAGPGNEAHSKIGPNRARAEVVTKTFAARYQEATQRTLTRAIEAGR